MGLGIGEEQEALGASVRGWALRSQVAASARSAAESDADELPSWWDSLAGQGLVAAAAEGGGPELAVILDELGRCVAPGPYLPTVLAAVLVQGRPPAPELLPGILDGSAPVAVALGDQTLVGRPDGGGVVAAGDVGLLLGGAAVRLCLVPVDLGDRRAWYVVDAADVTLTSRPGMDPGRRIARLSTAGIRLGAGRRLDGVDSDMVRDWAVVLLSAEAAGIAGWCLDTACGHARDRIQFGRPIGAFQAVKHRCADMLVEVELARAAAWDAARAVSSTGASADERRLAVATAGAVCLEAAVGCAKACIQILGGIGFTWEHDAHLYLKRAVASRQLVGGTELWRRRAAITARAGGRRGRKIDLPVAAESYRPEVRSFLDSIGPEDAVGRRRRIAESGYLVPHWPAPYGRDAGPLEQLVIDEEFRRSGVERPDLVIGNWALPTILQYGTAEQRARFVPPTLAGEISWCQMFSEPEAGSDLASLQTRAVRVDGGWSISGQKVWTSSARQADWAICLARTGSDGQRRHEGITYFLIDMTSPGIDVRPLRELTGEALFNEIFLSDVFVADDCVVGEVGRGWSLARTTLANERVAMSSGSAFPSGVEDVLEGLAGTGHLDDQGVLDRVGRLVCLAQADGMLGLRSTLARVSGTDPGAASSVRKLVGMHLRQDAAELGLELLGPEAAPEQTAAYHRFLASRALTIAGGTSEVLRNVVGERILGLPRG
ncbi:MAG TPA: acyl-CoA dehydrogenase [Mycobacteriales bacterium]|nr:acyl-CoA dehydrogenase [Mycobacteriales bacterium]